MIQKLFGSGTGECDGLGKPGFLKQVASKNTCALKRTPKEFNSKGIAASIRCFFKVPGCTMGI